MEHSNNSGLNTTLLIIILLALVGGGVWYASTQMQAPQEESGVNIEVSLPADGSGGGTSE